MRVPLRMRVKTRVARARRRARDRVLGADPGPTTIREDLALRYLRGHGLEIGALNRPLRVPRGIRVRYVDNRHVDELRVRYPEFAHQWLVEPDVIDDAERLATIADEDVDFVIANHVLEHLQDPVGALRSWCRVTRPGGVLFLAVPDKRATFDGARPSTAIEHLLRDAGGGPEWSRSGHYEEWARLAEHVREADVAERARRLEAERHDIHFHVWTLPELLELFTHLRDHEHLPLEIEHAERNDNEALVVLRRSD